LVGFSILFTPVGFISALVKDNSTGYKRQLVVMGLKNSSYWLSCFLTDISTYLTISIAAFIFTWAFNIGYAGAAFPAFVVIILLSQVRKNRKKD
jgi:4-hydroxybenzoate polyprenyltransferase